MRKRLGVGGQDLVDLVARARTAEPYAARVRARLAGTVRPEIAELYAAAPGAMRDLVAEIRRLQAELQPLVPTAATRVDDRASRRGGDVAEAGKKRRRTRRADVATRRVDADDDATKGRVR